MHIYVIWRLVVCSRCATQTALILFRSTVIWDDVFYCHQHNQIHFNQSNHNYSPWMDNGLNLVRSFGFFFFFFRNQRSLWRAHFKSEFNQFLFIWQLTFISLLICVVAFAMWILHLPCFDGNEIISTISEQNSKTFMSKLNWLFKIRQISVSVYRMANGKIWIKHILLKAKCLPFRDFHCIYNKSDSVFLCYEFK